MMRGCLSFVSKEIMAEGNLVFQSPVSRAFLYNITDLLNNIFYTLYILKILTK